MAFADPQSVTIAGAATSLPRTGQALTEGSFTSADGAYTLRVKQLYKTRTRREIRLDATKIVTDPLFSTQNKRVSASIVIAVDQPQSGFTATELKDLAVALFGNLTASTNANLIKLVGGES